MARRRNGLPGNAWHQIERNPAACRRRQQAGEQRVRVDQEQLRVLAETLTGDAASIVRQAAMEIELLNRHLFEARTCNEDSQRLDWLSQQAHDQYYEPAHRAYFTLPRILARKNGLAAMTLRDAIDLVRNASDQDF
jgi:hypothetical protein